MFQVIRRSVPAYRTGVQDVNDASESGLRHPTLRGPRPKNRRPVGGEDRARTGPEAVGRKSAHRADGPVLRRTLALPPLRGFTGGGGTMENKAAISACPQRQKCM